MNDGRRDLWVASLSAELELRWTQSDDEAGLDGEAHGVVLAADGSVLVTGFSTGADGDALWLGAYAP